MKISNCCKISCSHNGVAEDSSLLVCCTVSWKIATSVSKDHATSFCRVRQSMAGHGVTSQMTSIFIKFSFYLSVDLLILIVLRLVSQQSCNCIANGTVWDETYNSWYRWLFRRRWSFSVCVNCVVSDKHRVFFIVTCMC